MGDLLQHGVPDGVGKAKELADLVITKHGHTLVQMAYLSPATNMHGTGSGYFPSQEHEI